MLEWGHGSTASDIAACSYRALSYVNGWINWYAEPPGTEDSVLARSVPLCGAILRLVESNGHRRIPSPCLSRHPLRNQNVDPFRHVLKRRRVTLQGMLARNALDLYRKPSAPHGLQDLLGRRVEPGGLASGPPAGIPPFPLQGVPESSFPAVQ